MGEAIILPDIELCFLHTRGERVFRRLSSSNDVLSVAQVAKTENAFLENSVLKWLLNPSEITQKLQDPNFALYGIFVDKALAGFELLRAIPNDNVLELALCCTEPRFRSQGIGEDLTLGVSVAADQTSAHLMYSDALCTHNKAQRGLESAGFQPVGILPDFETFGSQSNHQPQTLVRYVRFPHGDSSLWQENTQNFQLTQKSKRVLSAILTLLEAEHISDNDNVIPFPNQKAS
jgi:hypothetical protein